MGILNVTPDSFSDGGQFLNPETALRRIEQMIEQGADIIDIGAESSRPGASFISESEEWARLSPILTAISSQSHKINYSVDTNKPEIMRRLPDYGVQIINDIKGTADTQTLEHLAKSGCTYIAMHMQGTPDNMQDSPMSGQSAVHAVEEFYRASHSKLTSAGFTSDKIWLDPGIGFGKDDSSNLHLLASSLLSSQDSQNIVIGISRKSFIGRLCGLPDAESRDPASKMLEACFLMSGIKCIRTHEVSKLKHIRDLLGPL